jgi:hypothetical protein
MAGAALTPASKNFLPLDAAVSQGWDGGFQIRNSLLAFHKAKQVRTSFAQVKFGRFLDKAGHRSIIEDSGHRIFSFIPASYFDNPKMKIGITIAPK